MYVRMYLCNFFAINENKKYGHSLKSRQGNIISFIV